jgi:uncharacterized protein YkwD
MHSARGLGLLVVVTAIACHARVDEPVDAVENAAVEQATSARGPGAASSSGPAVSATGAIPVASSPRTTESTLDSSTSTISTMSTATTATASPSTFATAHVAAAAPPICGEPAPPPDPDFTVVPRVPRGFAAYATGTAAVQLLWIDASDNETGFRIERRLSPAATWQTLVSVAANTTEYVDGGLSPGTTYYYQIFAFNDVGDDTKADFASVRPNAFARTLDVEDTAAPIPLSGSLDEEISAHVLGCREVYILWGAWIDPSPDNPLPPSGLLAYNLYRDGVLHRRVLRPQSFYFDRVEPLATHRYHVTAVDGAGNESASTSEVVVTGIACPVTSCGEPCSRPPCAIDFDCDPENCGACGNSCLGAACVGGRCQPTALTEVGAPGGIAPTASGIYFKANNALKRIDRDGSGLETIVGPPTDPSVSRNGDLLADGNRLYYLDEDSGAHAVYSLPIGGSGPEVLCTGGIDPVDLAVTVDDVLIADQGTNELTQDGGIYRCPKISGPSAGMTPMLTGLQFPNVLATNSSNYFWGTWPVHKIYRENYDGSTGTELAGDELHPISLHASETHLYWLNQGNLSTTGDVVRYDLDTAVKRRLTYGQAQPWLAAYDDTHVYWVNLGSTNLSGNTDGQVMKMPLAGGIPTVLAEKQTFPLSIGVDEENVYWMTASSYELDYLWKVPKGSNRPDPPFCGNLTCDPMEDCFSCSTDCGFCEVACGDGSCQMGVEDCTSCPDDCGPCVPVCGDGVCGVDGGEICTTCDADCNNQDQICGNGQCFGNEDSFNCFADCGPAQSCSSPEECQSLRDPQWAQWEQEVLVLFNELRAAGADCGSTLMAPASPLSLDGDLERAAQLHAWDMTYSDYLSHVSCNGRTHFDRANDQDTSTSGEIIAGGFAGGPAAAVNGWMASELHCAIIMNPTKRFVGIGYAIHDSNAPAWVADFR